MADLGLQFAQLMSASADVDPERQRILDVAREEFVNHGFRRTAIGEIARRAGVSRPTIYRRCGDKDEIVVAVVVREVVEFFGELTETLSTIDSPSERAVEAFVAGMRATRSNPLVISIKQFEPDTLTTLLAKGSPEGISPVRMAIAVGIADETLPLDAAQRAAELMIRITASLLMSPAENLPTDTDESARLFARTYFVPLIEASARYVKPRVGRGGNASKE